ncbi:MAG: RlmE family RNA methyltransferase [SAR116 cluster bacterium]|nr:rRNA methyltransferase [Paracoccaceae bacterium]RCL81790.1 MAG: RlmE family RNA methyltransferase [SAR116 cluster bacterium]RPH14487.1 MAG: RlmE family RNA methyltransferase [Alphaproteobacteria bacterium TMED150]HCJ61569.1 rRNA methyltransferase [Alphaproteobacteria bacterium]|tara:strand:+ start:777 stop:1493 length:717 start_codon:yes stop_codon:yes gene_type:complete
MSGPKGSSRNDLKVRVKTARGRRLSSTRWLERQLNDPYVREAKKLGYKSRAAFKLQEMDDKYGLLKPGMKVLDLGAAPGGWLQVAAQKVGSVGGDGRVLGIDLLEIEPIAGCETMQMDFLDDDAEEKLLAMMDGPMDLVVSDMAAATTGHKPTDHLRTTHLCECALDFAIRVLAPNGGFVAKVFQGGATGSLMETLKQNFKFVKHVKPNASRKESVELYVVAQGFRGGHKPANSRADG